MSVSTPVVSVAVRMLGEFAVEVDGVRVASMAPMPTLLLASLAARSDQLVAQEGLVEELWPTALPGTAQNTLQSYVLKVRQAVGAALQLGGSSLCAKAVVTTQSGGYRLNTYGGFTDRTAFRAHAEEGYRARRMGAIETAAGHFRQALDLWTGNPFDGVARRPRLSALAARLVEEQLGVTEAWVDCELERGRHHELLAPLAEAVITHPDHEELCARYMLALYRSGRRAEAKRCYERLVDCLRSQHQMDPSASVRRLHQMICDGAASGQSFDRPAAITERVAGAAWELTGS